MIEAYVRVEESLGRKVVAVTSPVVTALFASVDRAVKAGDFAAAYQLAAEVDFEDAAAELRSTFKQHLLAAAMAGARMVNRGALFLSAGSFDRIMSKQADKFALELERSLAVDVYDRLVDVVARAERGELVTKADDGKPQRFVRQLTSFRAESDDRAKMLSSLHTARLAAWGFTAEADVMGVDTYRLTAVLDGRTSAFCEMIHGREFEVSWARELIVDALEADDPQDLRTLHPWPKQTKAAVAEYGEMSSEELADLGYFVPPFHPGCRTICTRVDSKVQSVQVPDVTSYKDYSLRLDSALGAGFKAPVEELSRLEMAEVSRQNAAVARYVKKTEAQWKQLSDEQRQAVVDYTSSTEGVHPFLLGQGKYLGGDWADAVKRRVDRLDSALSLMRLPDDFVLYRGVDADALGVHGVDLRELVGREFRDPLFGSTSLDLPVVISEFLTGGRLLLRIRAKKGSTGGVLMSNDRTMVASELEVLLPRNSRYRIIGTSSIDVSGRPVQVLDVVLL